MKISLSDMLLVTTHIFIILTYIVQQGSECFIFLLDLYKEFQGLI